MENNADKHLRYPIGPFIRKDAYTAEEINFLISEIESAPGLYKDLINRLSSGDLNKTYRSGSWNVRQLVHHVADIQLLHFLRMKKALTEPDYTDVTLINMDAWAATPDASEAPALDSLLMLEAITSRYVFLLKSLDENALKVEYYHPVRQYSITQAQAVAMSEWHLRHHLEHIRMAVA